MPSSVPSPATEACAEARRPGRPRDARADHAILAATLELTSTGGLPALSMDAVAARAGVSKATIYRRWTSKEALVLDAWSQLSAPLPTPDTGSLRGDLEAFFYALADKLDNGATADILPHLLAAGRTNTELEQALRDYVRTRRQPVQAVLRRARQRGELAAGLDLELVQDLVVGPLMYRVLVTGAPVNPKVVTTVLDAVLAGLDALGAATDD